MREESSATTSATFGECGVCGSSTPPASSKVKRQSLDLWAAGGGVLLTYLPAIAASPLGPDPPDLLCVCVIAHADEGRRASRAPPGPYATYIRAIIEAGTPRYGSTGGASVLKAAVPIPVPLAAWVPPCVGDSTRVTGAAH